LTRDKLVIKTNGKQTPALKRAEGDSRSALDEARALLDEAPQAVEQLGDMGRATLLMLVHSFAGENPLICEAQTRFLALLQRDIEGPDPAPLERLLAQEIVLCRLHLLGKEAQFAARESYSFAEGDFWQRQIDRAQRRYLAAVKTLADIRRMQLPAVQVNVAADGGRQLNVAASRYSLTTKTGSCEELGRPAVNPCRMGLSL
jgi:hypothetical protein